MKLGVRFALLYLPCVVVAALLPIHPYRSMTRAFVSGGGGDVITWDWELLNWPMIFDRWIWIERDGQLVGTLVGAAVITTIAAAILAFGMAAVWTALSKRRRTRTTPG